MFLCHLLLARFEALSGPAQERKQKLDDARLLHQFYRDVADELSWIQEKQPMASSADLGKNLIAVQNLHKKHQVNINYVSMCYILTPNNKITKDFVYSYYLQLYTHHQLPTNPDKILC